LSTQYVATGTFSDETTQDLTFDALWESSAADVVSFSDPIKKGLATAMANGSVTINATLDDVSGKTQLTVTAAVLQSVALSLSQLNMVTSESTKITAKAYYSDTSSKDVTTDASWTSNNTNIATVGNDADNKGLVSAIPTSGSAVITATYGDKTANVTVKILTVQNLTISPTVANIPVSTTASLIVTANFADGSSKDVTSSTATSWLSSNDQFAFFPDKMLKPGIVEGKSAGNVTITVTYGGKTATASITVP
jgi:hypothetical protein